MSKQNGHHIFSSSHGEELVSYIYGEIPQDRRNVFEAHLSHCDDCAAELAAFSDARLGVIEWRREEFEHLATPEIPLPLPEISRDQVAAAKAVTGSRGWFESLTAMTTFAKLSFGFAGAALAIVVIYFSAFSPTTSSDIAENSPAGVDGPAAIATPPVAGPELGEKNSKPSVEQPKEAVTRQVPAEHFASTGREIPAVPTTIRQVAMPKARRVETAANRKAPRLNSFEEEEDRSLRLSDLFAEVGTGGGE
jgi:hypothetical protein